MIDFRSILTCEKLNSDLLPEKIKTAAISLTEPKNAVIFAVSVAGTYVLYKTVTSYLVGSKSFPDFPGSGVLTGHRSVIANSVESSYTFNLNPNKEPAGYVRLLMVKFLMVCDLKTWREIYSTNGLASSGRPRGYMLHMDDTDKQGLLFATGETWKMNRRIFLNHLRRWGRDKQFELVLDECSFLLDTIEESPNSLDPARLLEKAFSNVICTFIFGSRIDYSDSDIEIILGCLDMFNLPNPFIPDFLWPILAKLQLFPSIEMRCDGIKRVKSYIRKRIESLLSSGPRDPPETLVEAYALEIMSKGSGQLNWDFLIAVIHELFFAGTETTSTTVQWFLALMASHPEVQEKLFEEIQSVIGDGKLTFNHFKGMDYMQAVQFEVQRFGCAVQTSAPHKMLQSVKLDSGREIRKDEVVFGSIRWVMRQKDLWKFPDIFNPENFLDENGKFQSNDGFIPYGMGPRICLGHNLADLELKVTICELIRKFKITPSEEIDLSRTIERLTCGPYHYKYNFFTR